MAFFIYQNILNMHLENELLLRFHWWLILLCLKHLNFNWNYLKNTSSWGPQHIRVPFLMQNFNKFLLFKKIQNEINPRDNSITLNFMSYNMLHFKLDLRLFFFSHSSKFNNSLDFFIFSVMPKLIFFIFFFSQFSIVKLRVYNTPACP